MIQDIEVWISRLGEVDVRTLGREAGQVLVSQQPTLGSLFKSQNASTWTQVNMKISNLDLIDVHSDPLEM